MKRKIWLSILCVALSVCLLGFASACHEEERNPMNDENGTQNMEYKEVEGGYSLVGIGEAEGTHDLIVPATYNNMPVLSIEPYAFETLANLETVKISEGVKNIGAAAFYGCFNITKVELPSTIESIGNAAFNTCSKLVSINIPAKVTTIGQALFYNCGKLASIEIPADVTKIGGHAFNKCSSLATVTFKGQEVAAIGEYAFAGCAKLTSVDLPSQVETVAQSAFDGCSSLESVSFGSDLTSIGAFAFNKCVKLASVELHEGIVSIGESAFDGCTNLVLSDLPDSVEFIDKYAFRDCGKVGKIEGSVHYIGTWVVGYDSSLKTIANPIKSITINNEATGIANFAFSSCKTEKIIVGASIEFICDCAFSGTIYVKSFEVHEDNPYYVDASGCIFNKERVENAGEANEETIPARTELIAYPTGKTSKTLNNNVFIGVKEIAPYALYWAAKVTKVDLDFNISSEDITCQVEKIGEYAFGRCHQLKELKIGKTITSIADYAFYYCSKLVTITVSEENEYYKSVDNALYTKDGKKLLLCATGDSTKKILTVEDGTEEIAPAAFYDASYLEGIVLPASLKNVGDIAFGDCFYLTSVFFKGTVEEWASVLIDDTNNYLTDATFYIYSEEEPALTADGKAYDGNYWRYVDGVPTAWFIEVEESAE